MEVHGGSKLSSSTVGFLNVNNHFCYVGSCWLRISPSSALSHGLPVGVSGSEASAELPRALNEAQ